MAFKRNNFHSLTSSKKEYFGSTYKFSKKVKFEVGSDVYVIPLGLESGFYETLCHKVNTHRVDKQIVGFNGSTYPVYIKCEGYDEEGNKSDSLCCELAKKEKDRFPEKEDSGKRLISFTTSRIHLPVLILGNSLQDDSKTSYPINKVSILKDLKSDAGLKFSFIDMAASSFKNDIILAYGKKLKEEGLMDYELSEESEEFFEEVRKKLVNTVIKVHGVSKQGFQAALKEYSFFPFDNAAIASASPAGEREAIVNYKDNADISTQVNQFLTLFNVEVDSLIQDWTEKDLQEYYNSAIGADLKTGIKEVSEEKVELIDDFDVEGEEAQDLLSSINTSNEEEVSEPVDEDVEEKKPTKVKEEKELVAVAATKKSKKVDVSDDLDEFSFDTEDEDSFFED